MRNGTIYRIPPHINELIVDIAHDITQLSHVRCHQEFAIRLAALVDRLAAPPRRRAPSDAHELLRALKDEVTTQLAEDTEKNEKISKYLEIKP